MQLGLVTAAYQGIATILNKNTRQRALTKVRLFSLRKVESVRSLV